jgi:hyperosmotically inducible periplasmic protein
MRRTHGLAVVTLASVLVVFFGAISRATQQPPQDGVAAKAGEKLDEFGRAIRRGFFDAEETVRGGLNKTGETVREGFARTKDSVQGMGLVPRVYGRLHWDKSLHGCNLFVKAEAGRVTIRGTVPDDSAKDKAVALVKDTVGVTHVIVQLTVAAPSTETTGTVKKEKVLPREVE